MSFELRKGEPTRNPSRVSKYDYDQIVDRILADGSGDMFLIAEDAEDFSTLYAGLHKRGLRVVTETTSDPGDKARKNVFARMRTPVEESLIAKRSATRRADADARGTERETPTEASEVQELEAAVANEVQHLESLTPEPSGNALRDMPSSLRDWRGDEPEPVWPSTTSEDHAPATG